MILKKKIACQTRSNHNKGELGCIPGLLLKRHQKTSMISSENKTQHIFYPSLLIKHGKLNKQSKRYSE